MMNWQLSRRVCAFLFPRKHQTHVLCMDNVLRAHHGSSSERMVKHQSLLCVYQVLKQIGRWDLPSNVFTNAMMSGVQLTATQITDTCSNMYEGTNGYASPSQDTYGSMGTYMYEQQANEPTPARDILKCPTPLAWGTTPTYAEEG